MENIILYFYAWFVIVMVLLIVCPKDRIRLITDFFSRVLPKVPITGIVKLFKTKNEKQKM
jgi:hypothetical protein